MNPSEEQIEEYTKRAKEIVQKWLNDIYEDKDNFLRTCTVCKTPLRDTSTTGDEIMFVVTTTVGSFEWHNSQVYCRCSDHSNNLGDVLDESKLVMYLIGLKSTVKQDENGFTLDVKSSEFHK